MAGRCIDYADPGYQADGKKRYPLDSEHHIRAAWAFIHMPQQRRALHRRRARPGQGAHRRRLEDEIDPAGPPAAAVRVATPSANQAALDHVHDCLKAMTGGDCCKAAKATGRQSKTMLGHLKEAHDALCRAGATCDGFVADGARRRRRRQGGCAPAT